MERLGEFNACGWGMQSSWSDRDDGVGRHQISPRPFDPLVDVEPVTGGQRLDGWVSPEGSTIEQLSFGGKVTSLG